MKVTATLFSTSHHYWGHSVPAISRIEAFHLDVAIAHELLRVITPAVDLERNRIALSMKSKPDAAGAPRRTEAPAAGRGGEPRADQRRAPRPAGRPEVKAPSFVPKSGAVAPNGIRFK